MTHEEINELIEKHIAVHRAKRDRAFAARDAREVENQLGAVEALALLAREATGAAYAVDDNSG